MKAAEKKTVQKASLFETAEINVLTLHLRSAGDEVGSELEPCLQVRRHPSRPSKQLCKSGSLATGLVF